jgi:hypothetical protein
MEDGLAVDAAVPVPVYMVAQVDMPKAAYVEAAKALHNADPHNGGAILAEAEARLDAGEPAQTVVPVLQRGLVRDPAYARGWTLLAGVLASTQKDKAAKALAQALLLAPRDFWVAGARARAAAKLWSVLDSDTRAMALTQTQLLWNEPLLRPELRKLLSASDGAALVTRAFDQDDIRTINRWVAREQRRSPPP